MACLEVPAASLGEVPSSSLEEEVVEEAGFLLPTWLLEEGVAEEASLPCLVGVEVALAVQPWHQAEEGVDFPCRVVAEVEVASPEDPSLSD